MTDDPRADPPRHFPVQALKPRSGDRGVSRSLAGLAAGLILLPTAGAAPGSTTRMSVAGGGAQADGRSFVPAISSDGRFATFYSDASNLVAGDANRARDVFVRDRQTGETTRVSVDSAGAEANDDSFEPAVSADGRFVAFSSSATNLVAGDSNDANDVFVRDRQANTTTRVSVGVAGRTRTAAATRRRSAATGGWSRSRRPRRTSSTVTRTTSATRSSSIARPASRSARASASPTSSRSSTASRPS